MDLAAFTDLLMALAPTSLDTRQAFFRVSGIFPACFVLVVGPQLPAPLLETGVKQSNNTSDSLRFPLASVLAVLG